MAKRTCKIDGCDKPHKAYGWCRSHYARWQRHGDVMATEPIYRRAEGLQCSIEGCDRPLSARGWCKAHHNRHLRHGDVMADVPIKSKWAPPPDGKCTVRTCDRAARARGWCTLHYGRWKADGDVRADEPSKRGRGFIDARGYRLIWVNKEQRPEHRVVMERILGRPLLPGENVHHKNGERADNRPQNLELWLTKQPCGQRVEDIVAWAHEILARYEGLVLPSSRSASRRARKSTPPPAGQDPLFDLTAVA